MRQLLIETMPDSKGIVYIKGKDARYLSQVLRVGLDSIVDARLPSGNLVSLRCIDIKKGLVSFILVKESLQGKEKHNAIETGVRSQHIEETAKNFVPLWLFQCVGKAARMDTIIRQATEVGVERIIPILSAYSPPEAKKITGRLDRWNRIIKEARQQSGSPIQTTICDPVSVTQAIDLWNTHFKAKDLSAQGFIFTEGLATNSLYKYLVRQFDLVGAVIGPEGGFSQEEVETFKNANFIPIHFNINILRTETAALYSLANLQYAVMEFESWKASE